jgi:glucokinase
MVLEGRDMAERYALGIDFGGTKVLSGVVDLRSGEVLGAFKKRTSKSDSADELMERLYEVVDGALKAAKLDKGTKLAGIGVGIAGQVDSERGMLLGTPNLSRATVNLPVAEALHDRYGVPATLGNDVQVAALGEARFGAGKDSDDFLCVFVGTGIGGAIVRNGELLRGAAGTAGEIGHLVVDVNGRFCGCGGRGHLEAYASRTAITRAIVSDIRRGRPSSLAGEIEEGEQPGGMAIRSGVLARAIAEGDGLAQEAVREAGTYLGVGLASAINLLNPARIILGGGVIEAIDLLFEEAKRHARRDALPTPARTVEIVRAGLGDNSGVVGAAIAGAERSR